MSQDKGDMEDISERLEKSLSMDTEERLEKYNRLIQKAKDTARDGDMQRALSLFKKAYKISPSDKILSRINRIEQLLAENDSSDNEDDFVDVEGSGLALYKELHDRLYDYQRQGVAFLYSLYRDSRKGGILADDMGLGKTIQVISFLSGMYDAEHVKTTLLIVPTSLIPNWTKEFAKWTPGMRVKEYHGTSKSERAKNLEKVQRRGGVLITTYNMILNNWQILASYHGREFAWDYMILDEAHKIKSTATKTAKSAYAIPSKNRVLLTGTPLQNNLREMWALFDFACQGMLLGTSKTFKAEYENPITRAREKDATPGEKALGLRMSQVLMDTIEPYFLRRTKAEVQKARESTSAQENGTKNGSESQDSQKEEGSSGAMMPKLPRKNDLIVWTYLSAAQEDIYRQFLSLEQIQELLMTTKSPLAQLNIMKKLCDHPRLLSPTAMAKLGLDDHETGDEEEDSGRDVSSVPDDTLISESGKMVFLFALLERLREEGHRTLVFAQFRKVLDIIERILKHRGFKVMRLDGTIMHMAEREKRITGFQKDQSYHVFLLTTKVGGVGITLTAANRVVIYDPSWNPATDAQAVDRAYRIGQKKNVVIYRLITCGTVEEKIYRRQVFKDSLIRQNTGDKKNPFRYFSKQELKELFTLEDTKSSSTQLQLQAMHSQQRRSDVELDEHIAHLHSMDMFGISDHDLMFSVNAQQDEALWDQEEHHYIEGRVQKAQELVKAESEVQKQLAESMASSTEAAWLRLENQPQPPQRRQKSPRAEGKSPPMPSSRVFEGVVDLENSAHNVSAQQNTIDLTEESMEDVSPTDNHKVKTEHGEFKQNLSNHDNVVISDDEPQENDFHSPPNVKQDMPQWHQNGDVSMNENDLQELQNVNCSMNNLIIEDSIEEAMDMSVQNIHSQEHVEENKSQSAQNESNGSNETSKVNQSTEDSYFTAEELEKPPVQANKMNFSELHGSPLKNKRLSALQGSFKSQNASKTSNGLDSLAGDFNLELGESGDMFSENDFSIEETEEEEKAMLSALQLDGSFDVERSLAEHHRARALSNGSFALDESSAKQQNMSEANESLIAASRRKRVARIYSDDEEEEEEEEVQQRQIRRDFEGSFHLEAASTPKAGGKLERSRNGSEAKAARLNTSVASRRSMVLSMIDDMDDESGGQEGDTEEEEEDQEEEEEKEESEECIEDSREDDVSEGEEEEEPSGETLDTEEEESVEESTADPELSSNEQVEEFGAGREDPDDYEHLVQKGRLFFSQGKQEEALGYFLRAIDIKPGDPEIQLLTIQLYRQLSQKK